MKDLDAHQLQAFTHAYSELESSFSGLNVVIETYFADVTAEAFKTLTGLKGVTGYGFDLVRGTKTLDLIKGGFPSGKYLFAGVVDGRNIWANDLASSLSTLEALEGIVGKGTHYLSLLSVRNVCAKILSMYGYFLQTSLLSPHPALFSTLLLIS